MKIHNIYLSHTKITVKHNVQESLLASLEKQGIYPEYQCRSGYCGACRTKLKKGKVSYPSPPLAFINPGEVLLCCCRVEEDLELEI